MRAEVSLARPSQERGSGQTAIVELCNLDGFVDVTSSGAHSLHCAKRGCDQVIAISWLYTSLNEGGYRDGK